jgi:predicted GIY-YIG superfamily endonuclease
MNDLPVTIYALQDPRNGQLLYVGRTINQERRIKEHLSEPRHGVRVILEGGLKPTVVVLERCVHGQAAEAEQRHILAALSAGHPLANRTYRNFGRSVRDRERIKRKTERLIQKFQSLDPVERRVLLTALWRAWPQEAV